jgi:hypothetical protein
LRAVLCDGPRPVAEVVGLGATEGRADAETLVTRTTARLFPPLVGKLPSEAGWSPGTPGVSLGGWIGSDGGSGIGVGVGF